MKIILFGASGMVGQGILRECLLDPDVEKVLVVLRSPLGQKHEKLREIIHSDFFNFSSIEQQMKGYDACFYSVGITSVGTSGEAYERVTYRFTLAAAEWLAKINPYMTFIFVSAMGADSSEKGNSMWARVKGKTENALFRLPLKTTVFRPGLIQPLHGITSKTKIYRIVYAFMAPFIPILTALFPGFATTTERIGRAMLKIAKNRSAKPILETKDINAIS